MNQENMNDDKFTQEINQLKGAQGPGRDQQPGLASIAQVGVLIGREEAFENDV